MNMHYIWVWPTAAVALALFGWIAYVFWYRSAAQGGNSKSRSFRSEDWQPTTMRPLTQDELRALKLLRKALPECLLLPQIALARFISVAKTRSYNQWFGSVGRRCVDFLVCSEQGDVLGVIQLHSGKAGRQVSEGVLRKLKTLEMAEIPVWQIDKSKLPDVQAIRAMVMPELQAAEQHSLQHPESEWQATRVEPLEPLTPKKRLEAAIAKPNRWNQVWPTEEARSSEFLDEMGMIAVPPLVVKGSGRTATGFTRG